MTTKYENPCPRSYTHHTPFFTCTCILLAHYNKSIICALNLNFDSSKIKQPIAYGVLLVHACHFYANYACIEQNQIMHNCLNKTSGLCRTILWHVGNSSRTHSCNETLNTLCKITYQNRYYLCHTGYIIIIIYTNYWFSIASSRYA